MAICYYHVILSVFWLSIILPFNKFLFHKHLLVSWNDTMHYFRFFLCIIFQNKSIHISRSQQEKTVIIRGEKIKFIGITIWHVCKYSKKETFVSLIIYCVSIFYVSHVIFFTLMIRRLIITDVHWKFNMNVSILSLW